MSGSIVRALDWDLGYEQRFLAVNPLGDEVTVYQTQRDDPGAESNALVKAYSHNGVDHILCLAYLRSHVGWTAVGTSDGVVHVFDVTSGGRAAQRLRVKHARQCNAVSFNSTTLVAATFDKSRQDASLQVWDVARAAALFLARGSDPGDAAPLKPHLGFLPNEASLSAVFNHADASGMLLMAGGYKLVREFDLRDPGQPVYQLATKCTTHITLDPFQLHQFASVADDGSVAIWDRRRLGGSAGGGSNALTGAVLLASPMLYFLKLVGEQARRPGACLRYLSVRRGEFAAMFNGNLIRRWNTGCVPASERGEGAVAAASGTTASWKHQAAELYGAGDDQLFVALVLDAQTDWPRVVSFDYSPDTTLATLTNFVCMREKGLVFRMPVVESIEALDFNGYNEFTMAGPEGTATCFALGRDATSNELLDDRDTSDGRAIERGRPKDLDTDFDDSLTHSPDASTTNHSTEKDFSASHSDLGDKDKRVSAAPGIHALLDRDPDWLATSRFRRAPPATIMATDICATMYRRATAGYGVDATRNVTVVSALLALRSTWRWLELTKAALDARSAVHDSVDLGYVGVLAMWRGAAELEGQARGPISDATVAAAVRAMARANDRSAGLTVYDGGDRRVQRQLCLEVCGWSFTAAELDARLEQLASTGHEAKAAAWAVFHGDVGRAASILAQSSSERLRVMAAAVSAGAHGSGDAEWRAQCRRLAADLDCAYLRAIFAYVADRDWWDVLDEHAVPLRERVGVAVRFLADRDLAVYLARVSDHVVARGDLEGLVLTGLTPRGIDLLQLYVDRTGDVQTAALMAQYAVPRYFVDERVTHWTDCYRELLNLWTLFRIRAHFDVGRMRNSRTASGVVSMRPPPRQVFLQCGRCNKNMGAPRGRTVPTAQLKQFLRLLLKSGAGGDACPQCGAPLPRCAICLLTLGTAMPDAGDGGDAISRAFDSKISFCLSCNHGYHAHHAEEWFSKHYVCPVPDCNCRCNSK